MTPPPWTRLYCPGDRSRQDTVIALAFGGGQPGLFVRERRDGEPGVSLFVRGGGDGLRDRLAAAGVAGRTDLVAAPLDGQADGAVRGPGTAELMTGFLVRQRDALLAALAAAATRGRVTTAVDLAVAHLPAAAGYLSADGDDAMSRLVGELHPLPLSFPSLQAHADGIIAMSRDPLGLRRELEIRYARLAVPLRGRVAGLLDQLAGRGPVVSPEAAAWHAGAARTRAEAEAGLRSGRLAVTDHGYETFPWERSTGLSELHRFAFTHSRLLDYMRTDPGYLSMRLLMGLLYLGLHAGLGIALGDRLFVCYAAGRACQELSGVPAERLLARVVEAIEGVDADRAHAASRQL